MFADAAVDGEVEERSADARDSCAQLLDFKLAAPKGTPGAKFVFAVVRRDLLRKTRDSRWDMVRDRRRFTWTRADRSADTGPRSAPLPTSPRRPASHRR